MATDTRPYLALMAQLRLCVRAERSMSTDDMLAQDRIYARAVSQYEPAVVAAAVDEWSKSKQFWPELAPLMALCNEHEQLSLFARTPKLPAPAAKDPKPLTDDERLALWRTNDDLASSAKTIAGMPAVNMLNGFRLKRWAEHPQLAARYYAEEAAE